MSIPADEVRRIIESVPDEGIMVKDCTPDMVSVFLAYLNTLVYVAHERVYRLKK